MKISGKTNKQLSAKSEKAAAAKFGGHRQIASGALHFAKGDIKTERYLIEDKITRGDSFTLTSALWDKIRKEALHARKRPLFRITLGNGKTVVVAQEDDFLELLNNQ